MYSSDVSKVTQAMKSFDDLVGRIKANPTDISITEGGMKKAYWVRSPNNPAQGIGYVEYGGKPQSIMNIEKERFNKQYKKPNDSN